MAVDRGILKKIRIHTENVSQLREKTRERSEMTETRNCMGTAAPAPATRYNLSARRTQPAAAGPERERSPCARPRAADYTSTSKPARPTATFAAALAGVPRRPSFSSADSTPLSNAAARAAQPASVICVPLR